MSRPRTCIVFGAGPGIGNHTATSFALAGLSHIILLSRNLTRLQNEDAPFITSASPSTRVSTLQCNLADLTGLPSVLQKLSAFTKDEDVEVIFFNAARIKATPNILDVPVEEIHEDLKTTTLALHIVAQHFLPALLTLTSKPPHRPALLITSSHLPRTPAPELASLSLAKAAQANLAQSYYLSYKERGLMVGLVNVEGVVSDENKVLSARNIGERVVGWWKGEGEKGVEMRLIEK